VEVLPVGVHRYFAVHLVLKHFTHSASKVRVGPLGSAEDLSIPCRTVRRVPQIGGKKKAVLLALRLKVDAGQLFLAVPRVADLLPVHQGLA
jgi:hypothetical protein